MKNILDQGGLTEKKEASVPFFARKKNLKKIKTANLAISQKLILEISSLSENNAD